MSFSAPPGQLLDLMAFASYFFQVVLMSLPGFVLNQPAQTYRAVELHVAHVRLASDLACQDRVVSMRSHVRQRRHFVLCAAKFLLQLAGTLFLLDVQSLGGEIHACRSLASPVSQTVIPQ